MHLCQHNKCPTEGHEKKNRNNQTVASVPTEEMSSEKFHYEELTPYQIAALHQKRWAQHLDGDPIGGE
jgi:hypothetical protein